MSLQISFKFKKLFHIITIIFFLSSIKKTKSTTNSGPCSTLNCNGLIIRHPFWIPGLKESRCGLPGFNITCNRNKPVININGDNFIVKNINYTNNSLLLSQLQDSTFCPVPRRNFSVENTPFSYGPSTIDLFFFYNCTVPYEKETYAVDCASYQNHHAFAVFHVEILEHWNYSIGSCQPPVNAAVEADKIERLLEMNYTGILNKGFVLQWENGSCNRCQKSGRRLNWGLKIGIGVGAAAFSALIMCLIFFIYHKKISSNSSVSFVSRIYSSRLSSATDLEKAGVHVFKYSELEEATKNFDPKQELGDGGFGAVYKGKLRDGRTVAVKRLYDHNFKRLEQFINEIQILTRIRHQNLVSLYGCTSQNSQNLILVYEYIPNGTLADHLHGPLSNHISWPTRLKIAIETATALSYLHASNIIHRDVKTTNILLDTNFQVKVADFGLSRLIPLHATHVSTCPQGTPGYVDPEYYDSYRLTDKSDVYSFGVVLVELISSKSAVDIERVCGEVNLSAMAVNRIRNDELAELVDPDLGFGSDREVAGMVTDVAELAFLCLQSSGDLRPSMEDVVRVLEEVERKEYGGGVIVNDVVLVKGGLGNNTGGLTEADS